MIFFFKKKPLVLNCVTDRHDVMTYAPIQKTSKFFPDWWKRLPKSIDDAGAGVGFRTMKTCAGMRDLFQHGIIIPMWSDAVISVGKIGEQAYKYQFSDKRSIISADHSAHQRGDFAPADAYQHIKVDSPWLFSCEEAVPLIWTEPTWNMGEHLTQYRVLPAVVDYKYQTSTNINLIASRKLNEVSTFMIPHGQPLVQLTPLTERELKINLVEDDAMFRRLNERSSIIAFINTHDKRKTILEGKCPHVG